MNYENLPDEQERIVVEELKSRLENEMPEELYKDEFLFKRFIRARNYDVDEAEIMLRNHLNWRIMKKVDKLLTEYKPHEVLTKYIPITCFDGNFDDLPIIYLDMDIDTRGILKVVKKTQVVEFGTYFLEKTFAEAKEKGRKLGKEIEQFYIVLNFANFSLSTATHKQTLETFAGLLQMFENNYPERLKEAYCINTSYYFQLVWTVLKHFLTGRTFQKIWIMSKDFTMSELHKKINPEFLPESLGGRLTDPDGDPDCKETLNIASSPVPEKYFTTFQLPIPRIQGAVKLTINRMSKAEVKLIVLTAGHTVEWAFETKSKDIGFALLYKETENSLGEALELIPRQRVETEVGPEVGMFYCEKRGVYILEFDNTYSWVSSKDVYYKAGVVRSAV